MTTIAQWLPHVSQARQAMLDLLTSGVPQHAISVVFSPAPSQRLPAMSDPSAADDDQIAYESMAALGGASTYDLPAGAAVTAIGPLAAALGQASGATAEARYSAALHALGVSAAEAQSSAQQLSAGGALIAVRADPVWENIIDGVFRHAMNPSLNGPREIDGPDSRHDESDTQLEAPGAAIGGLAGGTIPGGWGNTGLDMQGLDDETLEKDRTSG
jgi:hypothetical protein